MMGEVLPTSGETETTILKSAYNLEVWLCTSTLPGDPNTGCKLSLMIRMIIAIHTNEKYYQASILTNELFKLLQIFKWWEDNLEVWLRTFTLPDDSGRSLA
jgi:hypothetical protein